MTTLQQVMKTLEAKGNAKTLKVYASHGLTGNKMFGVMAGDLKVIAKSITGQQDLALELYDTDNPDAMYLAGLVADGGRMGKKQLEAWVKTATWIWASGFIVPWVTSESDHGRELALKWMNAKQEHVAAAGWCTYSRIMSTTENDELDLEEIKSLLKRIEEDIDGAEDRIRYTMNAFVIAVGSSVTPLSKQANATAKKIGKVDIDMRGTSCKVPLASEYIAKIQKSGRAGRKRQATRC